MRLNMEMLTDAEAASLISKLASLGLLPHPLVGTPTLTQVRALLESDQIQLSMFSGKDLGIARGLLRGMSRTEMHRQLKKAKTSPNPALVKLIVSEFASRHRETGQSKRTLVGAPLPRNPGVPAEKSRGRLFGDFERGKR